MKRRILSILLFVLVFIGLDRGIGWLLNNGLNRYFGLNQHSEVLLIGHSHLMLAIDKSNFEKGIGLSVSKYCREGVNVADRYEMVKQYLSSPYSDSLQVVLYGVDQFMFTGAGLSENSYKLFYPFIDEENMNEYIKESAGFSDYWVHKLICTTRYSDALINSAIRGYRYDWSNYKVGYLDVDALKEQIRKGQQRHIHFEQDLIDYFEKTLELLMQKGIKIILVNTPIAAPLNGYETEQYQKIISYFRAKADSSSLIYYWDFNPQYSTQYELFFDPIHLNPLGQRVITKQIIDRITQII